MRVDDTTQERQLVAGEQRGVGGWTGEEAVAAGDHGGAVNTRHRAERRGDKIGSGKEESQDV